MIYNLSQIIPINDKISFKIVSYVGFILSKGNILSLDLKSIWFSESISNDDANQMNSENIIKIKKNIGTKIKNLFW